MTTFTARPSSAPVHSLAEGPVWDDAAGLLRWVDIETGTVFGGSLTPEGIDVVDQRAVDDYVGAVVPGPGGRLLVAGQRQLWVLEPDGSRTAGPVVLPTGPGRRLNDGACDPAGRFLVGSLSMGQATGREVLCRWEDDGTLLTLDDDLTLSNGLAWSPDGTTMYSIDTVPGLVWRRPYDPLTGAVGARVEHLHVDDGSPDGMCADRDGNLWIALWGRGQVRCYAPDGSVRHVVDVPGAPQPTAVAFAGPDLDVLVITTASVGLEPDQVGDSGRLFTVRVPATGLPTTVWNGAALPSA